METFKRMASGFDISIERLTDADTDSQSGARSRTKETVFSRRRGGTDDLVERLPRGQFVDADAMKDAVRKSLLKPRYNVTQFYHKTGIWQRIARNQIFENATLGVIAFNALWISIDTDNNNAEVILDAEPIFQLAENSFCFYFTFEWFVRFMSFRRKVDCFKDAWFVFDSMLVFMMVMETWVLMCFILMAGAGGGGSPMGNASILRLFRLLRLSRMARMLRSMPELMILIKGMVAATRSVFFTMCLLILVMYIFSIVLKQLADGSPAGEIYFATIPSAMYTLLIHGTFLDNLGPVVHEISSSSLLFAIVFYIFLAMAALMVMNMLIGVLCEVVSAVAATEKEEMTVSFVKAKMSEIVSHIDEDGSGEISKSEFCKILENHEAVQMLQEVGVDPVGLPEMADFIFDNGDGAPAQLSFSEFMEIVLDLRGSNNATVKDVMNLTKFIRGAVSSIEQKLMNSPERMRPSQGACSVGHDSAHGSFAGTPHRALDQQAVLRAAAMFHAHQHVNTDEETSNSTDSSSVMADGSLPAIYPVSSSEHAFPQKQIDGKQTPVQRRQLSQPSDIDRSRFIMPAPDTGKLEDFVAAAQDELNKFAEMSRHPGIGPSAPNGQRCTPEDALQLAAWASKMQQVLTEGAFELQRLKKPPQVGGPSGDM